MGSGSFIYEASTNTYSSIAVTTTAGSALPGAFFQFLNVSNLWDEQFAPFLDSDAADLTGATGIGLTFSSSLTDAGGIVGVDGYIEAICSGVECFTPMEPQRLILSGSLTGVALPEPGTFLLLAMGLIGAAGMRRSKIA
jgi:hypothetical protein